MIKKTKNRPVFFEETNVGKLEREIWEASDKEIDKILQDYGIPSPSELGKLGSYIQTTPHSQVIKNRRKNDILFIAVGSTEYHGKHLPTGTDTLFVTQILEGLRRYTAKRGRPISLAWSPTVYGAHPYHHLGMPGSVIIREDVVREHLIDVMLGFWNDGWRKQILVNNHGQFWVLEAVIQQMEKRYQIPGIFRALDWHRVVRKFFRTKEDGGAWDTDFVHADEAETSIALLLFPEMVKMRYAVNALGRSYLPEGHIDKAVDRLERPSKWSDGQGHMPIEWFSTPEGVVGKAKLGKAYKAKRPLAAILKYLTLLADEILEKFPPGKVPPTEEMTFRSKKEMAPFLKEPGSKGWKPIDGLPKIGKY